jgi:hypothetical protein
MEEGFCFIYVAGITIATRQLMLLEVKFTKFHNYEPRSII